MNRFSSSERVPLRGWWRRLGRGGQICGLLTWGMLLLAAGMMVGGEWAAGTAGPWPAGAVILLVGVLWAVGVAVASGLRAGGYLVAGLWLGWHGVALMGAWTGTPLVGLPLIWWLVVGLAVVAWRGPRRKAVAGLLWLAMALGTGYLLAGPGGWSRLPGKTGELLWMGRLLAGGGLAAAGWWILPRLRGWAWTEPGFGKVLGGSLTVMAAGLGASVWRDAEAAAGWAWGVVEGAGFLASLGWFWLGGLFAAGLVVVLEAGSGWMGRGWPMEAVKRRAGEGGRWFLPGMWLAVTGVEWLATHDAVRPQAGRWPAGLIRWMQSWPADWRLVAEAHAWVGVAVVVLGAGFCWQGNAGRPMLGRLNAVWGGAFLCLAAVAQALPGGAAAGDWDAAAWVGPVAILTGGGLGAVLHSIKDGRGQQAGPGAGQWGVLLVVSGVLLAGEGGGMARWREGGGAAALLGLVHLALPLVLYRWWTRGCRTGRELSFSSQAGISVAGLLVVLPLLHRDAATVSQMAFCPVLWLPVLLWLRLRQPALDMASGSLAGGLLGSATVAAWSRPGLLLPEVPLFSWLNPPSGIFSGMDFTARPFINPTHFTLLLLMTTAGALLGAMIFRAKPAPGLPLMPLLADPVEGNAAPSGAS